MEVISEKNREDNSEVGGCLRAILEFSHAALGGKSAGNDLSGQLDFRSGEVFGLNVIGTITGI